MTPAQILLVQTTFQQVVPIREQAAQIFYNRLFQLDPSLRSLFVATDLRQQGLKLMASLGFVVRGLHHPAAILDDVRALARRHAEYGVEEHHFAIVGEALLWTLRTGLGQAFTPAVREAWAAAYAMLSRVMIEAMRQDEKPARRAAG
jgi:hemoglobin-like flavoprotein